MWLLTLELVKSPVIFWMAHSHLPLALFSMGLIQHMWIYRPLTHPLAPMSTMWQFHSVHHFRLTLSTTMLCPPWEYECRECFIQVCVTIKKTVHGWGLCTLFYRSKNKEICKRYSKLCVLKFYIYISTPTVKWQVYTCVCACIGSWNEATAHALPHYPTQACAKGLSNRFCPSVSLSVQWKILKSEYRQGLNDFQNWQ